MSAHESNWKNNEIKELEAEIYDHAIESGRTLQELARKAQVDTLSVGELQRLREYRQKNSELIKKLIELPQYQEYLFEFRAYAQMLERLFPAQQYKISTPKLR